MCSRVGLATRSKSGGPAPYGPRRSRLAGAACAVQLGPESARTARSGPTPGLKPDAGPVKVALGVPQGALDVGAWLRVEAPGFEVIEWDGAAGREVMVAEVLSEGIVLEFEVPDRRLLPRYRVRLVEVTGEDYAPRDVSAYTVSISR